MADGGWPKGTGEARTLAAIEQLRKVLGALEARLAAGEPAELDAELVAGLIDTLDVLARRVVDHEASSRRRAAALTVAVERLAQRLEAQADAQAARERALAVRLDLMLGELGRRREAETTTAAVKPVRPTSVLLAAASAAAALSVVGAGVLLAARPQLLPTAVTSMMGDLALRGAQRPPPPAKANVAPRVPRVASPVPHDTYAAAAQALAHGDATAIARLTGLAQAGDAEAQLHLASLYETGDLGLPRDVEAARAWTRRAAIAGDRMAMHNLALFLMEGEGGARDVGAAARWFRAAAGRGVVDSQYNLGLLYEAGRGVPQNLREAYRWFAIAANAGDVASREKQVQLEGRLEPGERTALEGEVRGFRPGGAASDLNLVIPPATTLAETQAFLARQGYYLGPSDGVASPTLASAAAAWRRDHPE